MIPLLSDYIISVSCVGLFLCVLDPFGAAAVKQSAGGEKKKTISVSPWRRSVRSIFPWETCGARLPSLCNSRRPTYLQGSSSATNTLVPLIPLILIICSFSITPPGHGEISCDWRKTTVPEWLQMLDTNFYKVKNANFSACSPRILFNLTVDRESSVSVKPATVSELIWSLK